MFWNGINKFNNSAIREPANKSIIDLLKEWVIAGGANLSGLLLSLSGMRRKRRSELAKQHGRSNQPINSPMKLINLISWSWWLLRSCSFIHKQFILSIWLIHSINQIEKELNWFVHSAPTLSATAKQQPPAINSLFSSRKEEIDLLVLLCWWAERIL